MIPARPPGRLFHYHQPTVWEFEAQLVELQRRSTVLSLSEYLAVVRGDLPCPPRAVLLTFDDGYAGTIRAADVMSRHGVQGVLFLAVDYLGGGEEGNGDDRDDRGDHGGWPWYLLLDWAVNETPVERISWDDSLWKIDDLDGRKRFRDHFKARYLAASPERRRQLRTRLLEALDVEPPERLPEPMRFLEWREARELAEAGTLEIASHGTSHHDLTRCDDAALEEELVRSRELIHERIGVHPRAFSYPDGRHDERVRSVVARHYDCAFALIPRARIDDPYRLPRWPSPPGDEEAIRRVLGWSYPLRLWLWNLRADLGLT